MEWLWTKPFSTPPSSELGPNLRTFVNIVTHLDLDLRAQVLDAGCGPGWLSELLARCGYWVTGVDISEDMIDIARRRVSALRRPSDGVEPVAEFFVMQVGEIPWTDRFDAVVLYDAMHHFDDELATLRTLHRALVPGGALFLREGVRPPRGSDEERTLVGEMERHGTLESFFDPDYLEEVLRSAGFIGVRRFFEPEGLYELSDVRPLARTLLRYAASRTRVLAPPTNTFVARKRGGGSPAFAARLEATGSWRNEGGDLVLPVRIENVGGRYWPTSDLQRPVAGTVAIAAWLEPEGGGWIGLPRTPLPRPVPPGVTVDAKVAVPTETRGRVTIDLVREGLFRFADEGTVPLELQLC